MSSENYSPATQVLPEMTAQDLQLLQRFEAELAAEKSELAPQQDQGLAASEPEQHIEQNNPDITADEALYAKVYHYMHTDPPEGLRLIYNQFRTGQLTDYVRYERARDAKPLQRTPDTPSQPQQNELNVEPTPIPQSETQPVVESFESPKNVPELSVRQPEGDRPEQPAESSDPIRVPEIAQQLGSAAVQPEQSNGDAEIVAPEYFEKYRQVSKGFSEAFVVNLLNRTLEVVPGERAHIVKAYLDNIPAQESDKEMYKSPEKLAQYHNDLKKFVDTRLRILGAELNEQEKSDIREAKQAFIAQTAQGFTTVLDYFQKFVATNGDYKTRPKLPRATFDFHGLNLETSNGQIDLLEQRLPAVKANIYMQRELMGLFVHWSSERYTRERFDGKHPEITSRIYLNPQLKDAVSIFDEVTTIAEDQKLMVKGKILHRSLEGLGELVKDHEEFGLRGDGIVLYAGEDTEKLLAIVRDVYVRRYDAFKGRRTSRIPLSIAPGVAVGEEPGVDGKSLTSHRAELIERVAEETSRRLGKGLFDKIPDGQQRLAYTTFVDVYNELAPQYNVSTHNVAFNATPTDRKLVALAA